MVILVVEDDPLINLTTSEELLRAGYEAISASNADAAVVILERRGDIDLVFTDIDMEGSMDGLTLAYVVRNRWPPVEIIVTSGKQLPRALPERAIFVPKPYRTEHLVQTMTNFYH